jgi:hypothetical protein
LPLLDRYERNKIPIYVDWSGATNYRDPRRRENVFSPYFHQPFIEKLGDNHKVVSESDGRGCCMSF